MRISVTGTACQGKTTFVNDFIKYWPNYTTPEKTYRDVIKEKNYNHSQQTTKDTQWDILNFMIDEQMKYTREDYVIFDRCPLDNIAYSIWACAKQESDIDTEFVEKCMPLVKESMKFLDIIFFTPITKVAKVELKEDDMRDVDPVFVEEIDHLLKAIKRDWDQNHDSKFFEHDNRPAMIDIFGSPNDRIQITKLYLDADGDCMGETDSPLVTEEELREMEYYKYKFGISDEKTKALNDPKGLDGGYK
jgi:hypothetical protein